MKILKNLGFNEYYPSYIDSKTQLFIDTQMIDNMNNIKHKNIPGEKHAKNPLIIADKPWEGWRLVCWGDFIYDQEEETFKMWYYTGTYNNETYSGAGTIKMLYATSCDGIKWDKPILQKDGTNRVNVFPDEKIEVASIRKDMDELDPKRRYKMICYVKVHRHSLFVSPDGINWTKEIDNIMNGQVGDIISVVYNPYIKKYSSVFKLNTIESNKGFYPRRCFYYTQSDDLINWDTPKKWIKSDEIDKNISINEINKVRPLLDHEPDQNEYRTDFYGTALLPLESGLVAFPWVFHISRNFKDGTADGPQDIQLAFTRDMVNWSRENREAVVPLGTTRNVSADTRENALASDWDSGYIYTSSKAIEHNDEIWFYYTAFNHTHRQICLYDEKRSDGTSSGRGTIYKNSIGLVKWKKDRLAALTSSDLGDFTTVPLKTKGKKLIINANTAIDGYIKVEIIMRDRAKREWSSIESNIFTGDELRKEMAFKEQAILNNYINEALMPEIRIRFTMKKASIYSFKLV